MESYSLADAKAHLSELVDRVEAGETVEITRRGKLAARIVPPKRNLTPADIDRLVEGAARLPLQKQSAADLIREMRDAGF